jgi:hypothetical protein
MSKAHRGRPLKEEHKGNPRGNCPLCKRSAIKMLYSHEVDGKKFTVCKQCNSAVKAGKFKEAIAAIQV